MTDEKDYGVKGHGVKDYARWLRGQTGPARLPIVYVTGVVRNAAGLVLFQERADFGPAWWGLPGGLLEPGETPEAALVREVFEETGLHVRVERLTGVYSSMRYAFAYPNGDQVQQVTACYTCTIMGGALAPQAGEIKTLAYFAPDALPQTSVWYADMLRDALGPTRAPCFDPPDVVAADTPYRTIMDLRRVIGPAAVVWPGAHAMVFDDDGRLLLQRRGDFGVWGLPGGALDVGETLAQAARRECEEETGLVVEPYALMAAQGGRLVNYPNGDQLYPYVAMMACRVVGGHLQADGRESLEVRFFSRDAALATSEYLAAQIEMAFEWYEGENLYPPAPFP